MKKKEQDGTIELKALVLEQNGTISKKSERAQPYVQLDFAKKNSIFANLQIILQILKVEHKSFPMMYYLSYLDIKHGIKRGGVQIPLPPLAYLGFQVPQQG